MATVVKKNQQGTEKKSHRVIRNIYLYLVAMIGLIVFVMGSVGILNHVLQTYVFGVNEYNVWVPPYPPKSGQCYQPYADMTDPSPVTKRLIPPTQEETEICLQEEKKQQEQNRRNNIGRELSIAIAQILIGLPLWLFHWGVIQKEYKRKDESIRN